MYFAGARADAKAGSAATSISHQQQWVQEGGQWLMAGGPTQTGPAWTMSQGNSGGTDDNAELRKRVSDLAGVCTCRVEGLGQNLLHAFSP